MGAAIERTDDGLAVLDSDELRLLRVLDGLIISWAEAQGAEERRYPFLLRPRDLEDVDYYENFPHLGLAAAAADPKRLADLRADRGHPLGALPADVLDDAALALPSAACYSVYFHLRGQTLPARENRVTTLATCFRNETRYQGLRRQLGFSMREIVFVGSPEGATEHLQRNKERVLALADRLGLAMTTQVATDPFFDSRGPRATMQRLFPVKEEFVVDDLAVGSVNYHRNFFGERCRITLPDGAFASTSCCAFGLERWVHALTARFGDARNAAEAVLEAA
jgi:seryl-tRNA synthetase